MVGRRVAGEQVTAVSELKVTEVCRVSCTTQRSIYTRIWCPTTVSNSELAKKEGRNIAVKGVAFPQQVDLQMVEQGCELHLLISPCCFPARLLTPGDTRSPL
jgi:hypothetical protein